MRQHAMHAKCNVVMPNPSVCPMPVLFLSSHFGGDIILVILSLSAVPWGNPLSRMLNTQVGEFCKYHFLSWKRYEIGPVVSMDR